MTLRANPITVIRAVIIAAALLVLFSLISCGGTAYSRSARINAASIASALKAQHTEWRGVRYREGGLSKSGVDCSGFVYLTFKKKFSLKIPRTTRSLARYGRKVRQSSLRSGDLVFFKTGFRKRHVGIYVNDGKFLHASTSRGVMLSRLDNPYWKKRYRQARRVLR